MNLRPGRLLITLFGERCSSPQPLVKEPTASPEVSRKIPLPFVRLLEQPVHPAPQIVNKVNQAILRSVADFLVPAPGFS
jgi:hypothetical protein